MQQNTALILSHVSLQSVSPALRDWKELCPPLFDEWLNALIHPPGLLVVLEDLEVEEDDEGEGQGDGGDEPVPGSTSKY